MRTRTKTMKQIAKHAVAGAVLVLSVAAPVVANSASFEIECPTEGHFEGPPLIYGTVPNPAGGWELYLEAIPRRIELQSPSGQADFWMITCHVAIRGAPLELITRISAKRKCEIVPDRLAVTCR